MTPEALRRRMAHGNIYPAERIDAALGNYFRDGQPRRAARAGAAVGRRPGRRGAQEYRVRHGITGRGRRGSGWWWRSPARRAATTWCGGRHAWRPARKADLVGVHVRAERRRARRRPRTCSTSTARCWRSSAAATSRSSGADVAARSPRHRPGGARDAARARRVRRVALGRDHVRGSIVNRVIRAAGSIDVHVISAAETEHERAIALPHAHRRASLPPRRRPARVGAGRRRARRCSTARAHARCASTSVFRRSVAVLPARRRRRGGARRHGTGIGHRRSPRRCYANWFFFPPLHTLDDQRPRQRRRARRVRRRSAPSCRGSSPTVAGRSAEAARARAEAETLVRLAGADGVAPIRSSPSSTTCADAFSARRPSRCCTRTADGWRTEAVERRSIRPPIRATADETIDLGDGVVLVLARRRASRPRTATSCTPSPTSSAGAFGAAARARGGRRGRAVQGERAPLRAAGRRVARPAHAARVDQGVGDVSLLARRTSSGAPRRSREFCVAIDEETDRLDRPRREPAGHEPAAGGRARASITRASASRRSCRAALASLGDRARHGRVAASIPETLPRIDTDPALLERAVANLIDNAIAWSPPEQAGAGRGRSRRRRRSTCGSSTAARASPSPIASASSSRSNGSVTARTAPASASVWPSRKASSGGGRRALHRGHAWRAAPRWS